MSRSHEVTIKSNKRRRFIAELLNADGKVDQSVVEKYRADFISDYPYPVKLNWLKVISFLFIFLFILSMFFVSSLKEEVAFFVNMGMILFCWIFFSSVRKIKYPNEQYSRLFIAFLALMSLGFLYISIKDLEIIISNLMLVRRLKFNETISVDYYDTFMKGMKTHVIIACGLSSFFMLLGILIGRLRFATVLTPLITLGGLLVFSAVMNTAITTDGIIQGFTNNTRGYDFAKVILSLIVLCGYDLFFILITKKIGGKKDKRR